MMCDDSCYRFHNVKVSIDISTNILNILPPRTKHLHCSCCTGEDTFIVSRHSSNITQVDLNFHI